MNEKTIFKRIIDGEIPADIVHEDDQCMIFRDVNPQAPVHLLVIPKKEIPTLADMTDDDQVLIGHLVNRLRLQAQIEGLEAGYRVVINCGDQGGQEVSHLHLHLLGGRQMKWPPG